LIHFYKRHISKMKLPLFSSICLGFLVSNLEALRCYECDSTWGEKCDSSNFGKEVDCAGSTCYFELRVTLVNNYKRSCGEPAMPGAGPRNYCNMEDGKMFCTCTDDLCNTVYNYEWENPPFSGLKGIGHQKSIPIHASTASLPLSTSQLMIVVFAMFTFFFSM